MMASVGFVVHYVSYGTPGGEYPSKCRAAIITDIVKGTAEHDDYISLCVLNPTGMFFNERVEEDALKSGGTWHWKGACVLNGHAKSL